MVGYDPIVLQRLQGLKFVRSIVASGVLFGLSGLAIATYVFVSQVSASALVDGIAPLSGSLRVVSALAGSLAAAAAVTLPVAFFFRNSGWRAGLYLASPMVVLRLPELLSPSASLTAAARGVGCLELAIFVAALVTSAWVASKLWPGSGQQPQRSGSS